MGIAMYCQQVRMMKKTVVLIAASVISIGLVYRGHTYEPVNAGLTVPLMCVLSAFFLMVTAIAMIFRSPERVDAA
jgi:uncharacterized membrane protein YvlD (DUF360 family)